MRFSTITLSRLWTTKSRVAAALLILLGVGILFGYILGTHKTDGSTFNLTLDANTPYPFIRPLIGVNTSKSYGQTQLASLRSKVAQVAASQASESIVRYAYYFRDLSDGRWTGINETDQYDPASMLKVVFAVAAYKQEESTPGFLSRTFVYTKDVADIQSQFNLAPPVDLTIGEAYSMPFLLKEMLSNSDNGAKDLIVLSMNKNTIDDIFTDLSITKPSGTNQNTFTISPQEYSRFLRILYYGTYDLSWKNSNNILKLLSEATFTDGLVAGVPSSVVVAHKFGEHAIETNGKTEGVELSDCGIVYHPNHPYLICVMTEGKSPLVLANFIAQISRATYDEVNANYSE